MPEVTSMEELLHDCVQDLHSAESDAIEVYSLYVDAATAPELKTALNEHWAQSSEQARRLEAIAGLLGKEAKGPTSLWAEGILGDAKRDTETVAPGPLLDAALIGAMRKLEQAEIVSYETALGVARALGLDDAVGLLERTRAEEQAMDARLLALLERVLDGVPAAAA